MAVRGWRNRAPGSVVREVRHTETRAETLPQTVLDRIAALEAKIASFEKRYIQQERDIQTILQIAAVLSDLVKRVEGAEASLSGLSAAAQHMLKVG